MVLEDEVEIDGKYAGGHLRPENRAEDRIDHRLKKYQNMKRPRALAIRQRGLGGQTFTRIIRDYFDPRSERTDQPLSGFRRRATAGGSSPEPRCEFIERDFVGGGEDGFHHFGIACDFLFVAAGE